jgi:hypothetical protein
MLQQLGLAQASFFPLLIAETVKLRPLRVKLLFFLLAGLHPFLHVKRDGGCPTFDSGDFLFGNIFLVLLLGLLGWGSV